MPSDAAEAALARRLRDEVLPALRRRMPWHHLTGLRHGAAVAFVERHRKSRPYFLRTDIRAFYPSVRHRDLVVGVQLAYRDLLGLRYVPAAFKKRYVGRLSEWCGSLPAHRGIPLGSALSGLCAPLMLVPLWLSLRRLYDVPVMVFMDDVLVCCRDAHECAAVYAFLCERLHGDFDLEPSPQKTRSGPFATAGFDFCGWSFAGGYARVSAPKLAAFEERLHEVTRRRERSPRALVKRVNRLVDGFGHYYKLGSVKRQFEQLDVRIRAAVRRRLADAGTTGRIFNGDLERLGLHSLSALRERHLARAAPKPARKVRAAPAPRSAAPAGETLAAAEFREAVLEALRSIDAKLTDMKRGQRTLLAALDELRRNW